MNEQLHEDPWTDEVCQDWLDMAAKESERLQLTSSEEGIYLWPRMPQAVREYRIAQITEAIGSGFAKLAAETPGVMPETIQTEINVSPINKNR